MKDVLGQGLECFLIRGALSVGEYYCCVHHTTVDQLLGVGGRGETERGKEDEGGGGREGGGWSISKDLKGCFVMSGSSE